MVLRVRSSPDLTCSHRQTLVICHVDMEYKDCDGCRGLSADLTTRTQLAELTTGIVCQLAGYRDWISAHISDYSDWMSVDLSTGITCQLT